jgi:predicted Zn-dependent protease
MKRIHWVVAGIALALLATSANAFVSEKEVRRQARVIWLSMKRHVPLESDAQVLAYVQCISGSILAQLPPDYAELDWEVVVFDDDQVNAFADPNGKIGVFTGLLNVADTPDALAAVIGHEVAHVTEGHSMRMARRSARQDMLAMLGSAATGMHPDLMRQGITIGLAYPYAREQETEADLVGLKYMANAGYDPRSSIYLWKNMAAANQARGQRVPEFLSTHPSDSARIDTMIKNLTPALVQFNAARESGRRPACYMAR